MCIQERYIFKVEYYAQDREENQQEYSVLIQFLYLLHRTFFIFFILDEITVLTIVFTLNIEGQFGHIFSSLLFTLNQLLGHLISRCFTFVNSSFKAFENSSTPSFDVQDKR